MSVFDLAQDDQPVASHSPLSRSDHDALYRSHAERVRRQARRLLSNLEDAEDLAQEIFLQLFLRRQYCPRRGTLSAFLSTVVRTRGIDRLRSRANQRDHHRRFAHLSTPRTQSAPIEEVARLELCELVRSALAVLPAHQRQALVLAYFEGLSQSQIASELQVPIGTIKSRCRSGLLNLRRQLGELLLRQHDSW
jgi:RNA polymerase sigma-70 factor (ECF subfamily)